MAKFEANQRRKVATGVEAKFTMEEVAKHNTADDAWLVVDDNVYDITKFAKLHPGGTLLILEYAGKDATDAFYELHRADVLSKYGPRFFKGRLADAAPRTNKVPGGPEAASMNPGDLSVVPYGESSAFREGWHSPYYTEGHKEYRQRVRKFLEEEIKPEALRGDANDDLPSLEINKKIGRAGLYAARIAPGPHLKDFTIFGVKGEDFDYFHELITHEEWARVGTPAYSDGLGAGLVIGLPPVALFGNTDYCQQVVKDCLLGDKRICLAISEPFTGSDVANIKTTARKTADGKHYIVNGVKKWITNGHFSDYFVTAVRTGGDGIGGVSLLLIERSEGLSTKRIPVSYGKSAGTAYVTMENVKVPVENLLGNENDGFRCIMANFNHERWMIVANVVGGLREITQECFKWSMQRRVFGKKLLSQPVIREKLARMIGKVECAEAWLEHITFQMTKMNFMEQFQHLAGPIAFLKVISTRFMYEISDDACQIFGGRAITKTGMGQYIERFQRAVKFAAILGGSEEIMNDLGVRMAMRSYPQNSKL